MTRSDHPSGSDRIFEALGLVDADSLHDVVVNIQGDLPTIEASVVRACLAPLVEATVDIATLATPITREQEKDDPNVVKIVATELGPTRLRALYFTRARAPSGEGPLLHHIGLYAYRRDALRRFVGLPPSPLELREKLEQLRALEAGMRIDVALVDTAPLGVDAPEDGTRARPARTWETPMKTRNSIAYQGEPGANSHIACADNFPDFNPLPCATFEDAFAAVQDGAAELGMISIENSIAGRVADIHALLPASGLHIVGETFLPIHFQLLAIPGARIEDLKAVYSHTHALGQCRNIIRRHKLQPVVAGDTAGAAREVAEWADKSRAALAPRLAGEIYGLNTLASDVEDESHNTTRFVVLSRDERWTPGGRRAGRDDFRLSRAQRARRALQGAGGLRHQQRQHDKA